MTIEFYFFDKTTNTFKKVYFKEWVGDGPIFVKNKKAGKTYWNEKQAEEDLRVLGIITSPIAKTLSIKLVS